MLFKDNKHIIKILLNFLIKLLKLRNYYNIFKF